MERCSKRSAPWPNWIRHRSTALGSHPEIAGSSPAGVESINLMNRHPAVYNGLLAGVCRKTMLRMSEDGVCRKTMLLQSRMISTMFDDVSGTVPQTTPSLPHRYTMTRYFVTRYFVPVRTSHISRVTTRNRSLFFDPDSLRLIKDMHQRTPSTNSSRLVTDFTRFKNTLNLMPLCQWQFYFRRHNNHILRH